MGEGQTSHIKCEELSTDVQMEIQSGKSNKKIKAKLHSEDNCTTSSLSDAPDVPSELARVKKKKKCNTPDITAQSSEKTSTNSTKDCPDVPSELAKVKKKKK